MRRLKRKSTMAPAKKKSAFEKELLVAEEYLLKKDKKLAKIITHAGPCLIKIEEIHSPFASLAEAIIYQQLSGKAAASISQRVKNLFLEDVLDPAVAVDLVTKATPRNRPSKAAKEIEVAPPAIIAAKTFPPPQAFLTVTEDILRSAGLSRAKSLAIKDLALKASEGLIPSVEEMATLSDDELIERLTAVRGIGRWTVEMMLIFRLGRLDIMPATDYGVRKGFAFTYKTKDLPKPSELLEFGKKWKPYQSVASWYLWRACEMATRKL